MRIAVAGGKGGCGKTTTALALADALVDARREPIIVDCDRDMPNLHVYAGTQDEPGVADLAAGTPLEQVAHDAERPNGARIVPGRSGGNVQEALAILDESPSDPPLILDTPAGASEDVAAPLRFADRTVIVTTPSRPCLRAAVKTASMARALGAPPVGVVVSRAEQIPQDLPAALGVPRERIVAVASADDPLAPRQRLPVRRIPGLWRPNA